MIIFEKPLEKKYDSVWDEHIAVAERVLQEKEFGSEQYISCLEHLNWMYEQKKKNAKPKKEIPWTALAAVVGTAGTLVLGFLNAAIEYEKLDVQKRGQNIQLRGQDIQIEMAKTAYENDADLKQCDNKLWNMSQKIK